VSPPRVYVPDLDAQRGASEEDQEKEILLRREEREHVRSRRLRDGDEVVVLDGKGARVAARLVRAGAAIALLPPQHSSSLSSSSSSSPLPGEPRNRVVVALACAEPARVEWAVEKGTECGAAGFVLLACARSQKSHVTALSSPARLARLSRIAIEATKQCDRTIVPFVEGPKSTEEFLRRVRGETLVVLDPAARASEARAGLPHELSIVIGPEGGFEPAELSSFAGRSPVFLSLGLRILRLETAVVAALVRLVEEG
jgi:16S rRNA (uracil1498-N3)-methyltransferase